MVSLTCQFFLNHRLDLDELDWQVRELARAGYQGIYAHARQGLLTPYMSEDWWRAIDKIIEVCREEGVQFCIWDEDYFPSGLAGGRIVWEDPGLNCRDLQFTVTTVCGAGPFEVDFAPGMLLRAYAVPRQGGKVKLSDGFAPLLDITAACGTRRQKWAPRSIVHSAYAPPINPVGHPHWRTNYDDNRFALAWTPPGPGEYTIVATLVVPGRGSYPDMLRPESARRFLELTHEEYYKRYGEEFGKVILSSFMDEPSPGGALYPWTPKFPEEFAADHGYDIRDYLPHLAMDLDDRSPQIRHHYRYTQGRLQRKHFVGQIGDWCHAHNLLSSGHLSRQEWLSLEAWYWPNQLRCYALMDIPAADPLGASCGWPDAAGYHTGLKVASSGAHLFGKAQASSDAMAVIGDEAKLRDLKYMFDYQMVLGVNHFTVHGLSYSLDGPRKDEVPPSLFYQNTEWKHMDTLLGHVRETCDALTGGMHLCELAMLYPSTAFACLASPAVDFNFLPDEKLVHEAVETLLSHQRDFDFIDEITLQEMVDADGRLNTPEAYGVIILPHLSHIDAGAAEALLRFARAGGKVLCLGRVPLAVTADLNKPLLEWSNGSIDFCQELSEETLAGLPGCEVIGEGARDVFVLRREVDGEVRAFIFNRRAHTFKGTVDGRPVTIARGSSFMLTYPAGQPAPTPAHKPCAATVADISRGWSLQLEPNHIPLSFWHVAHQPWQLETADPALIETTLPGMDMMTRQPDPAGDGEGRALYWCRFMLTAEISDARLVTEDSGIAGDWRIYVNGTPIENFKRSMVFDCRNLEAPIGHALRGGSNPTLNVVAVETWGPGRGLKEMPYLYGSFTCQYRYGHLSFPFLEGGPGELELDSLQPWGTIGYPTFSGSGVYAREFDLIEAGEYTLDLGRVEDVAAVSVDGSQVAVLPWPPYRCSLGHLEAGGHEVAIEITNASGNRNRAAGLVSGLLGPVRVLQEP